MVETIVDWLNTLIINGDIYLLFISLFVIILVLVELYFWLLERDKK